jgi:hypothetical protein
MRAVIIATLLHARMNHFCDSHSQKFATVKNKLFTAFATRVKNILSFHFLGNAASPCREKKKNSQHGTRDSKFLFERMYLRVRESFSTAFARNFFCHDDDSQSSQQSLNTN